MRFLTNIFLSFSIVGSALAQDKVYTEDLLLFEKGYLLQNLVNEEFDMRNTNGVKDSVLKAQFIKETRESILEKSLEYYEELEENYPKSKYLFRALNNKGYIEFELGDKEEAKNTFLKIIDSKANDKELGGTGSGIMGEPYANYKNRAAKTLARICIADSSYLEGLKYLELTKKYPYRHFCGNEMAGERIYLKELYGMCYLGLKDYKSAFAVLLPEVVEIGLADNKSLVIMTYNALLKIYSKEYLRQEYEKAFFNYKTEKVKNSDGEEDIYYIIFLDTKIELTLWMLQSQSIEERENTIRTMYKESYLYGLLN